MGGLVFGEEAETLEDFSKGERFAGAVGRMRSSSSPGYGRAALLNAGRIGTFARAGCEP